MTITTKPRTRLDVYNSSGVLQARLQNAYGIELPEEYNALPVLTFKLPADDDKVPFCIYGNEIWLYIDGDFYDCYKMDYFKDVHSGGNLVLTVEAIQVGDRLNEDVIQDYSDTDTMENHLTALLALQKAGNQVTLGGVDTALNLTREYAGDGLTIWEAGQELRETVGGILYVYCNPANPTARSLWLKETIGENTGQQIRYRKNLKGITRKVDYTKGNYVTKLYPYGSGSLQLDTTKLTDTPTKSADATYGYLTLPHYSAYKNWIEAGNACPSGMILVDGVTSTDKTPTSCNNTWNDRWNAYDGNTGTYAYSAYLAASTWTPYYEYYFSADYCDAVKILANFTGVYNITGEISIYANSAWTVIYTGEITKGSWVTKEFTAQVISGFRVRFLHADSGSASFRLYEGLYRCLNIIGDWEQGAAENVIRCALVDYDSGAAYELTYYHAPYLINVDAVKEVSAKKTYETSDIDALRSMALVEFVELANPYTTYEVSVADLSQSLPFEFLKLGSLATVIDEDLNINVQTRIVQLTRYLSRNNINISLNNRAKTLLDKLAKLV